MSFTLIAKRKRLRGVILELLCLNHDKQESRFTSSALWSAAVRGLGFEASKNDVVTMLQDLKARGYVEYVLRKNDQDGEIRIYNIELCPKGRDLLEGTTEDPAVEL